MNPYETGVAFSGGGIRSAALCSGVLRRLLQVRAKIDYLSCVSGGGYTGTAFLDWKYRNEKKAKGNEEWHESSLTTCDKEQVTFVTGRSHVEESLIRL